MALELAQAQHRAGECAQGIAAEKARMTEAKMARQARIISGLDARLQAAHAALDAVGSEAAEWRQGGDVMLEQFAALLSGAQPMPGACNSVFQWNITEVTALIPLSVVSQQLGMVSMFGDTAVPLQRTSAL